MASRSTVRMPGWVAVAAASAAAAFASGDNTLLAGIDFRSEAGVMPHVTRRAAAVQPCRQLSVRSHRYTIFFDKIAKARQTSLELEFYGACRAVALLADDHL